MSIHTLNRIYYVTTGVFVSLLAVFAVLLFFGQRELTRATSLRYVSYLLADELRQSSDDLTRMARTYIVTGDPRFERMYWEILAIRNGEAPRPRHYERVYWDLMGQSPAFHPTMMLPPSPCAGGWNSTASPRQSSPSWRKPRTTPMRWCKGSAQPSTR